MRDLDLYALHCPHAMQFWTYEKAKIGSAVQVDSVNSKGEKNALIVTDPLQFKRVTPYDAQGSRF